MQICLGIVIVFAAWVALEAIFGITTGG